MPPAPSRAANESSRQQRRAMARGERQSGRTTASPAHRHPWAAVRTVICQLRYNVNPGPHLRSCVDCSGAPHATPLEPPATTRPRGSIRTVAMDASPRRRSSTGHQGVVGPEVQPNKGATAAMAANSDFWKEPEVKQGWLLKRAGNWDFWHTFPHASGTSAGAHHEIPTSMVKFIESNTYPVL